MGSAPAALDRPENDQLERPVIPREAGPDRLAGNVLARCCQRGP